MTTSSRTGRGERFAEEFLVDEGSINLRGIEERPEVDGMPDHLDTVGVVDARAVAMAEPHAAEPDRRNTQTGIGESAIVHALFPSVLGRQLSSRRCGPQ